MTEKISNELIYEVLKDIQQKIAHNSEALQDLKAGQINIREDINSARGDLLRHERQLASVEVRLEHIDARLGINETTQ